MPSRTRHLFTCAGALLGLIAATGAHAQPVLLTVQIENRAASNSVSFAPLHLGLHSGSYDAFNLGQVAGAAIISVAEGGSGSAWLPAFASADPTAVVGTIGGPLFPGQMRSMAWAVDPLQNPYFTYASMVIPSNDFFIGNDNPQGIRLFDAGGQLQTTSITVRARNIWDAGSEIFDPAASAFVGDNDLRQAQNSVVSFNFAELAGFNGFTTGANYVFTSGLVADSEVYRISFSVSPVPEPQALSLMLAGLMTLGWLAHRRSATASALAQEFTPA
jgi:hypothetical protein